MIFSKNLKEKLLPILVNRTVIFLFLMSLLTLFLHVIGTNQGFVDSTQLAILRLYSILAIFLVSTSIIGIIINIRRYLRKKKIRYIFRALTYFLLVIYGTVTVLAVMFILTLAAGTN